MSTLTVALADSYHMIREALRLLLETRGHCQVVGEAASGPEALALVLELQPDLLVADLSLPELGGIALTEAVRAQAPATRVILLSMYSDLSYAREALRVGAMAYVLKASPAGELLQAISQVATGQHFLSAQLAGHVLRSFADEGHGPTQPATLSSREQEVLTMVAQGMTSAAIAGRLGIGARTVEWHRARVLRKLGLHSVADLVRYALRHELIPAARDDTTGNHL